MATKSGRLQAGRRRGRELTAAFLAQILTARQTANVSQAVLSRQLGWSQSWYSEFERGKRPIVLADMCEVAALLGLTVAVGLHRQDEGTRDQGHRRLIDRLLLLLSRDWHVTQEAPFPLQFDLRSWDVLLRLGTAYRVGVEAETRIRDQQELVRRIRQRELHGGADHIIVVLSDSGHNRGLVEGLRTALGSTAGGGSAVGRYSTSPAAIRAALRAGRPLPGSGVILL